jgi:DNA-binding CsgD family transcriptional regulator
MSSRTDGAWLAELAPVRDPAQVAWVAASLLEGAGAARLSAGGVGVPKFSARQRKLVSLVAQGRAAVEIAAHLIISVPTVARTWTGPGRDLVPAASGLTRPALSAGVA